MKIVSESGGGTFEGPSLGLSPAVVPGRFPGGVFGSSAEAGEGGGISELTSAC